MASKPRTVKGPCFDCDDERDDGWEYCTCRRKWSSALTKSGLKTEPNPKLEPEDLRPNVPPRMMS